jgi:UDP-4-amino-4,6-dideoxy-N-acetyl-beta-L-altrosamine transaminase
MTGPAPPRPKFLAYGAHVVDESDIAAVVEVLRGDFLTTGPLVERFERAFAEAVAVPHVVSCSSGTAALHMACQALGLNETTVAVVPTITFLATANAARFVGAEVEFADVDPETGLLTAAALEEAVSRAGKRFPQRRVAAVFPVHLNGQSADMAGIAAVARRKGMAVVEDACHAVGGSQATGGGGSSEIGSCAVSDIACFSFHPVKTIATGEGGSCTTRDPELADRMRRFRNHGMVRDPARFVSKAAFDRSGAANPWYYEMPDIGLNYRASDIHCALALSQLGKLRKFVEARSRLVRHYHRAFEAIGAPVRPVQDAGYGTPAWHLMAVRVDFRAAGISRARLMEALRADAIGTQVHYIPVHTQPYYRDRYGDAVLPGAQAYYESALSLPLNAAMSESDVDRVVRCIAAGLGAFGSGTVG